MCKYVNLEFHLYTGAEDSENQTNRVTLVQETIIQRYTTSTPKALDSNPAVREGRVGVVSTDRKIKTLPGSLRRVPVTRGTRTREQQGRSSPSRLTHITGFCRQDDLRTIKAISESVKLLLQCSISCQLRRLSLADHSVLRVIDTKPDVLRRRSNNNQSSTRLLSTTISLT